MQFYPFITNRLNVIERTGAARMGRLRRWEERLLKISSAARVFPTGDQTSTPFSTAVHNLNPRLKLEQGLFKV